MASLRVASISAGEMPKAAARARSIVTVARGASFCWSVATSASSGSWRRRASTRGAQVSSSCRSVSVSVYWYWVREERPPTLMSWPACMNRRTPSTWAVAWRRRRITWSALSVRPSALGRSEIATRPVLKVEPLRTL